jgi:hypothetical protein
MAYLSYVDTQIPSSATTMTANLPTGGEYEVGDLLVAIWTTRTNTYVSMTSGWQVLGTPTLTNSALNVVAYRVATTTSETSPTLTKSGSNEGVICLLVVKDHNVPAVAPTIAEQGYAPASYAIISPSVASVPDKTLLVYVATDANNTTVPPGVHQGDVAGVLSSTFNVVSETVGYRIQNGAGPAPTLSFRRATSTAGIAGGVVSLVTIPHLAGGTVAPQCLDGYVPVAHGGLRTAVSEQNPTSSNWITGITADAATDVFTKTAHGLVNGDRGIFWALSGGAGLTITSRSYRVFNVTANTFQLSLNDADTATNFTSNVTSGTFQKLGSNFFLPISALTASIDGLATLSGVGELLFGDETSVSQAGSGGPTGWYGQINPAGIYTGGTLNLGDKNFIVRVRLLQNTVNTVSDKGCIVVLSDGTEWVAYRFASRGLAAISLNLSFFITINPSSATVYAQSAGSVNFSAITYYGVAVHRTTALNSIQIAWSRAYAVNRPLVFVGGGPGSPITVTALDAHLAAPSALQGFTALTQNVQLGDGFTPTYIDAFGDAMYSPSIYSIAKYGTGPQANIGTDSQQWSIKLGPSDTVKLPSIVRSTIGTKFVLDATSSTSATYDTTTQVIGATPTWKTGIPAAGALFQGCKTVDGKGASFSGCTFKAALQSPALRFDASGASAISCTFVSPSTGHGIEITAPGTYDLTRTEFTGYSGTSTDAAIYNSSGGAVTLLRAYADATLTVRNSVGSTTTIQAPAVFATATCLSASHVVLRNVTKDTWLYNGTLAGTAFSVQITPTMADHGDIFELRVSKIGYQDFTGLAVFSAGTGAPFLPSQPVDTFYAALGVDGSTVTEFSMDVPNLEVDADDLDGLSQKRRLAAFLRYVVTTDDGARYFWNAITLEDEANGRINADVLDLLVDNVGATQIKFTDNDYRLYRSDGTDWIKYPSTGGLGISQSSDKVYVAGGLNEVSESGQTYGKQIRDMRAVLLGKTTGGGSTQEIFYAADGTTPRVTSNNDGLDRTSVVVSGS